MEMWSRERNYGPGSSAGGGKYGPGREIMVLGQALVAGSVVQGEKPCPWVKPVPARVWSEERNYGLGSSADGGKCGPGREIMVLGQALVAGSVVQGEKLRVWVKPSPAVVWSREQNRGPGSSTGGGKCGPGRETAVQVNPIPARVWSEERNYGLGSSTGGGKYGPGSQTVPLGQARPSVVRGEKLWSLVKRWWREVWFRERNCGFGSSAGGGKCGLGSKTVPLGQAQPRPSVVRGEKLWSWVKR